MSLNLRTLYIYLIFFQLPFILHVATSALFQLSMIANVNILRIWPWKLCCWQRWASKSQIDKISGSFRYRKSAHFLGVSVRKPQIHKFFFLNGLSANPKTANFYRIFHNFLIQNSPKSHLFNMILYFVQIWITCEVVSPQKSLSADRKSTNYNFANHKRRLGPQITNPQGATFAKTPQF